MLQYLLEDAKLAERVGTHPTLQFASGNAVSQSPVGPMRLVKLSNLQDVNALVPGQTLSFDPALTAIFGGNGSGKSGYARVLGCAGFTRGDREVLPDVTKPARTDATPSADIELSDGTSRQVIHYQSGSRCPELTSFYVFDSASVIVHLTKANALSFSPTGLSFLTQLADVTDQVRERLRARIKQYSEPHDFAPLFQGESETRT